MYYMCVSLGTGKTNLFWVLHSVVYAHFVIAFFVSCVAAAAFFVCDFFSCAITIIYTSTIRSPFLCEYMKCVIFSSTESKTVSFYLLQKKKPKPWTFLHKFMEIDQININNKSSLWIQSVWKHLFRLNIL